MMTWQLAVSGSMQRCGSRAACVQVLGFALPA